MKKLMLFVLSLSTVSLWSAGELALQQGAGVVDQNWDDLKVDPDSSYVVYQNNGLKKRKIKVQAPDEEPYELTLEPDTTTVLSFKCGHKQPVYFWSYKTGKWNMGSPLNLKQPNILWKYTSLEKRSEKLQRDYSVLWEALQVPILERETRGEESESQGWIAGAMEYLFGRSNDDGPF